MIDTPVTKKFYKKLELYLELIRQDNRVKRIQRKEMIWEMEKYILFWAVGNHWHLGTPLTPEYVEERLKEKGYKDLDKALTRKVMENLVARNFAYFLQDGDNIQITDMGFLMGEVIEEKKTQWELIYFGFIIFVWLAIIFGFLKVIYESIKSILYSMGG